jgi:hypothetical protein
MNVVRFGSGVTRRTETACMGISCSYMRFAEGPLREVGGLSKERAPRKFQRALPSRVALPLSRWHRRPLRSLRHRPA